jgi:hypothetical protein
MLNECNISMNAPEGRSRSGDSAPASSLRLDLNSSAGPGWYADARHDRIFVPNAR